MTTHLTVPRFLSLTLAISLALSPAPTLTSCATVATSSSTASSPGSPSLAANTTHATPPNSTPNSRPLADLVARIAARDAALARLYVTARARIRTPDSTLEGDLEYLIVKPSRLRLQTKTPLGNPISAIVINGPRVTIADLVNERFISAPITSQTIATALPARASAAQLFTALSAALPPLVPGTIAASPADRDDSTTITATLNTGDRIRATLHTRTGALRKLDIAARDGGSRFRFDDYNFADTIPFPRTIQFENDTANIRLSLAITDFTTDFTPEDAPDDDTHDDTFTLTPSPGMTVIEEPATQQTTPLDPAADTQTQNRPTSP